jgi:hypothetical protein
VHRVLVGKPKGKNHWGDPDIDERIILKWMFRKWEVSGTVSPAMTFRVP